MFVTRARFNRMRDWANNTHDAYVEATRKLTDLMLAHAVFREALAEIVAQKTDKPNATVSRIIKIAEEALKDYDAKSKHS